MAGRYRLPWEDQIVHVDGRSCGFPPPARRYQVGAPAADGAEPTAGLAAAPAVATRAAV